jgi:alkylhydroperoxidase family enzyme
MLEKPWMRLIRPLLARSFRGKLKPPAAPPVPNTGLGADLVAALNGSPWARTLREILDDAFRSPILSPRSKVLMFAVIGRALGCERAEAAARRELAREGLSGEEVDEILTNLGSARLDHRERVLVPFARETVRYRTTAIQQRTRELASKLTREELIEGCAVAALANSMARLTVLLERC